MSPTKKETSTTLLTITVGFLILFGLTHQRWFFFIACGVGLAGIFSPVLSLYIRRGWEALSLLLSKIVPPLLFTLIFYLFLFPIALLSRLFGAKDPLNLKNKSSSLFKNTNRTFEKNSFEKPW
jgi:hypothetical protein